MKCPSCKFVSPDDVRFCPRCGEGLQGRGLLIAGLIFALCMPLVMGGVWWAMRTHYAHTPHNEVADPSKYRVNP